MMGLCPRSISLKKYKSFKKVLTLLKEYDNIITERNNRKGDRKMRTAEEMKRKALKNCLIVKYLENKVMPLIEEAAALGLTELELQSESIPIRASKREICARTKEWFGYYGYKVVDTADYKKMKISWNIVLDNLED